MAAAEPATGRIPLAVVVVDGAGLISHWGAGATRLFGVRRRDAVGRPAVEVLPASSGASEAAASEGSGHPPSSDSHSDSPIDSYGRPAPVDPFDPTSDHTTDHPATRAEWDGPPAEPGAGRRAADHVTDPALDPTMARIAHLDPDHHVEVILGSDTTDLTEPSAGRYWTRPWAGERGPSDLLWWAYPLLGPGGARLLLLAADGIRLAAADGPARQARSFGPAFVSHTELDGSRELAARLPQILPPMRPAETARIAEQVLRLGYPALEITGRSRMPVTPDWSG